MKIRYFSCFPRPLDFKYKSNIFIFFVTVLTFLQFSLLVTFFDFEKKLVWYSFILVFLVWAIFRELYPSYPVVANVFAVLSNLLLLFTQKSLDISIIEIVFILFVLRIISQSVGIGATIIDLLLYSIFAYYVFNFTQKEFYLIVVFVSFLTDFSLSKRNFKSLYFAIPSIFFILLKINFISLLNYFLFLGISVLISLILSFDLKKNLPICDCGDGTMSKGRIFFTKVIFIFIVNCFLIL
ncbi:MAG: hypothetical protein KatS3mg085_656 [Candidatus Dojkabacteria bacterium]|nr:MAG: hypothetical protein KatS3mg085_656 [Candidatus Dojkabacteria bacterium]